MISELCPQVYKGVTWNLHETVKWIRCVWIFLIPSMTPLHFLKRGWKILQILVGFSSPPHPPSVFSFLSHFIWHDSWIFFFRKYWTVFVYLKEEVLGSTKCLITDALSSHFWMPSLEFIFWEVPTRCCGRGMHPGGFVSGIGLPPAGEVFKCVGNCLVLLMGFRTLLNCNGSKFEEKWGLSSSWEWKGIWKGIG